MKKMMPLFELLDTKKNEIKIAHKETVTLIAIKKNCIFISSSDLVTKKTKLKLKCTKKNANPTSQLTFLTMLSCYYCFCDPNQVFMYLFSFFGLHSEYDGNRRKLNTKKREQI